MTERYILGINAYDHDVSACLLRNGEIAFAVAKERVTRIKHDNGTFQAPVDYCLEAAGIALDDVELIVENSYVLPVPEYESRLIHLSNMLASDREAAMRSPMFLSREKPVTICSHHLAHAYSAFAVSPFDEGAVMVVDGVGSYRCDVLERVPEEDETHRLARESESYYRFEGATVDSPEESLDGTDQGPAERRVLLHGGAWGALQPSVAVHLRQLEQVR